MTFTNKYLLSISFVKITTIGPRIQFYLNKKNPVGESGYE